MTIDDGPGSLRDGCRRKEPLWIVFEVSGTINLSSYLNVSSYKTIDGRGQRIKLTGKGLRLKDCEHVIICNLAFESGRGHDVDGIQIKPNSKHIWVDRCSLRDFDDGLIDITRASTDITISRLALSLTLSYYSCLYWCLFQHVSRCHFSQHDKTMLIGADPSHTGDRCIRVTIHHCFFDGTRQRHPRVRYGKVHLYNNYTRNWGIYAVCASVESQVIGLLGPASLLPGFLLGKVSLFSDHCFLFILDIRYTPNAIFMKQVIRRWPLNILRRR